MAKSASADLEELIDSTVTIPTIPTTLLEINRVIASEDGSASEAATIIEKDPAIAAKVLRLVNSSFYALRNPVSAIGLACSMVGLKVIRNIVVQASVLENLSDAPGDASLDPTWLWDHSFKTAYAARRLAKTADHGVDMDPDDFYTAGLVHDVGKIVLLQQQPEDFSKALQLSNNSGVTSAQAEDEIFGFSHADIVGLLAQRWKLSPRIQEAVTYHHATDEEGEEGPGRVIRCANSLAHEAAEKNGGYAGDIADAEVFRTMGIEEDLLEEIRSEVRDQSID